ncbi:hypothetical protein FDG57_gp074 [Mycobacterium phage Mutaforma13]|uniref:Uncharacterized protein n=2 Tax=Cheoctovirus TaxID=1623281 RepID=G1DUG2_9CAUD|nr:hypothetical protein FDG57_gp074 [Mycobacterium phage Mutaforma13]AEJ93151.1 hypothetical protein MUTAFORMA13_74 [Mycobacterium phage Mutaforma13]UVK63055.1 hypothetical protein SEA_BEAKIN_69 [Mycobacterium phage Beakin]WNM74051.1 hypothetical protein SEA_LUNABLU_71 [Mycobacterium Phage LunaBlu]
MKIGSLFSGAEGVNLMDAEALSTWRKRRRYHRSAWGRPSMPIQPTSPKPHRRNDELRWLLSIEVAA